MSERIWPATTSLANASSPGRTRYPLVTKNARPSAASTHAATAMARQKLGCRRPADCRDLLIGTLFHFAQPQSLAQLDRELGEHPPQPLLLIARRHRRVGSRCIARHRHPLFIVCNRRIGAVLLDPRMTRVADD